MEQHGERTGEQRNESAAQAKSLEQQLAEVEQQLQAQEEAVKNADQGLQGATEARNRAEAQRKVLENRQKMLAQLVNQLGSIEANLNQRRQAAEAVQKEVENYYAELMEDLEAGLSEAYRQHIDNAIAEEDQKSDALEDEVNNLKGQIEQTEAALAQAKAEVTAAETAFRNAQTELQQLSTLIQTAVSEVNQLRKAAEAAVQNRQGGDAYFLARSLENAIVELERVSAKGEEERLRNEIIQYGQQAEAKRQQMTAATEELNRMKAPLREAESALQAAKKQRAANIQKKIQDFPEEDQHAQPSTTATAAG
jgi:DNA repair exonuclease SbcCD ATPase subunit